MNVDLSLFSFRVLWAISKRLPYSVITPLLGQGSHNYFVRRGISIVLWLLSFVIRSMWCTLKADYLSLKKQESNNWFSLHMGGKVPMCYYGHEVTRVYFPLFCSLDWLFLALICISFLCGCKGILLSRFFLCLLQLVTASAQCGNLGHWL